MEVSSKFRMQGRTNVGWKISKEAKILMIQRSNDDDDDDFFISCQSSSITE